MDDMFVDFSEFDETVPESKNINLYRNDDYDETTTEFYRVMRERKLNIIMQDNYGVDPEKMFKYDKKWNPYTGEIEGIDPYGALYFHPDDLIHYFYTKRLEKLWNDPVDETGGYYQGYYGEFVGSDLIIEGRGIYSELYAFRLPITDCYLTKDHNMSIITMGPILTNEDIANIEQLAEKNFKNNYFEKYRKKRPSLTLMKKLYDEAISSNPDISYFKISNKNKKSDEEICDINNKVNRLAVDMLKEL